MKKFKGPFQGWGPKRAEAYLYEKILGSLAMAAIGDALGMPVHDMTQEEIIQRFGGPICSFQDPFPDNRVHKALKAAQITDDTRLTLATARALRDHTGKVTAKVMAKYLFEAVEQAFLEGLDPLFGQSTKAALQAFKSGKDPLRALDSAAPLVGATNGAAMRIAPIGLIHPGDPAAAVRDAVVASLPTHGTQTGISAACAVAGGVAEALKPQATVFSVVQTALASAEKGEEIGKRVGKTVPLPSVPKRIRMAISMALKAPSPEKACRKFAEIIGLGLPAYESVPTAMGIFLASGGDPMTGVLMGANIGNDTDTIASIVGAMAGALKGITNVPRARMRTIEKVNRLGLGETARELTRIAIEGLRR